MSARPRRRQRDGRRGRRCARRCGRADGDLCVTVVCAGEPAAARLRRLRRHAPGLRAPPSRAGACASARGGRSRPTATSSRRIPPQRSATRSRSSSRPSTRSSSRRTREEKSGWLRRNVLDRIRSAAGDIPVEHLVTGGASRSEENVLVIANETVLGEPLLDKIRERAAAGPASFLIMSPQSDPSAGAHPAAERRAEARGRASCAARASTSTARSRIPIRSAPRWRRCTTSASTRSSSRPSSRSAPAGCAATSSSGCGRRPACRSSTSPSPRPRRGSRHDDVLARPGHDEHEHHGPPEPHYSSRIKPGDARDVPVHRVGDHAFRLVLHGLLLRPDRQRGRRGRRRRTSCPSSSPRSTRASS